MDNASRAAFAALDTGEVDLILTGDENLAGWAERHGYRVRAAEQDGAPIYEIWPDDTGPDHVPARRTPPVESSGSDTVNGRGSLRPHSSGGCTDALRAVSGHG